MTGVMLIRAFLDKRDGEASKDRRVMLIPDSAHGTNPASAALAGFTVKTIRSTEDGITDLEHLQQLCDQGGVAGLMLTNPNTVGIFEKNIKQICKIIHAAGGLVYMDGANMNALVGVARPGDMGVDVIHLNLHKTFSTPARRRRSRMRTVFVHRPSSRSSSQFPTSSRMANGSVSITTLRNPSDA
jgi:glycine dehydrogenase subunit 2